MMVASLGAPQEMASAEAVNCECYYYQLYEGIETKYDYYINALSCDDPTAESQRVACINTWHTKWLHILAEQYMNCEYGDCFSNWCSDQYTWGIPCHNAYGTPLPWESCCLSHSPCTWDYTCLHSFLPIMYPSWRPTGCSSQIIYPAEVPDCPCVVHN
jgi:hypothetical protein